MIAMLVGTVMALLLSWRGLRSHAQPLGTLATTALIWAAIIALLALLISQYRG